MANPLWAATANGAWSTAGNWDPSGVPANSDNVYMRSNAFSVTSGFAQSAVTLALLEIERSFTGDIGTSTLADELAIGATLWNIGRHVGSGSPAGSDRIKINFGSVQFTGAVYATASSSADANLECVRIRGTNASNALTVYGGIVGVATNDPDDTATLATMSQFGGFVHLAGGCTLTTLNLDGSDSSLIVRSAFTTLNQNNGTATIYGSGARTTMSQKGGIVNDYGTGTVTTANIFEGAIFRKWSAAATITTANIYGTLDLSQATGAVTLTNTNILSENAVINDPLGKVVFTNAAAAGAGIRSWTYIGKGGATYAITA